MKLGTRSLLFGAHYPLHAAEVAIAWRWLYGQWPTWREAAAILVHDVGYFGCETMDGPDGSCHPELGARIADRLLGPEYGALVRGHSQSYAAKLGIPVSRLCWPDKLSHALEPVWWYVLRTRFTGEIREYRGVDHGSTPKGAVADAATDHEWFQTVRARMTWHAIRRALNLETTQHRCCERISGDTAYLFDGTRVVRLGDALRAQGGNP